MYYNETINCNCPPRCTELSFEKFVSTGQELQQCSILTATGGALGGGGGGQGSTNAKAAEEPKQSHMLPKKAEEPEEKVDAEYKVDKYVTKCLILFLFDIQFATLLLQRKYCQSGDLLSVA